jgi:hypothetical protein
MLRSDVLRPPHSRGDELEDGDYDKQISLVGGDAKNKREYITQSRIVEKVAL